MIYRKDNYYDKIKNLTIDNFMVVSDFDRTITTSTSHTTWGVLSNAGILPDQYDFERNSLYNYYRPIELNDTLDDSVKMVAMADWHQKHVDLLKKYRFNQRHIDQIFSIPDVMSFRPGAKEFFEYLDKKKIEVNILSAGVGDFIITFLENNNCLYDNLKIRSNYLNFDRHGVIIGLKGDILHSLNKSSYAIKKNDKKYVVLIGDQLSDVMMVSGYYVDNVIKIAFLPHDNVNQLEGFRDVFDMVLTDDESFSVIVNDLKQVIGS